MSLQVSATDLFCSFCAHSGKKSPLVRSMHGLYCTHEHCYSRVTDGNLVPPTACESCGENAFYAESLDEKVDPGYFCISCGKKTEI